MEQGAVFPLFYLPPIEYFSNVVKYKQCVVIEMHEHFPKQTFRNRASIHSPNGKLDLIIPIAKGVGVHTVMKDVKISYDFNWQRLHWQSLQTSYRSSAYFEFYEEELAPLYEKRWDFLFDYNEYILNMLLRLLKINLDYSFTKTYEKTYKDLVDFRECIHPKNDTVFTHKPYFQVFDERNGLLQNLSIVDLLFNQGPQSLSFLTI